MTNHGGDNIDDIDKGKDRDLHDEKISALYRQLPDAKPSADSDALIRARARRAVKSGPQKKHLTVGLKQFAATAAVLVLSVGLVVQWHLREPEKLADALSSKPTVTVAPAPAMVATPATTSAALAEKSIADGSSKTDTRNPARASAADTPARAAQTKAMAISPEFEQSLHRHEMADDAAFAPSAAADGQWQENKLEAVAKRVAEPAAPAPALMSAPTPASDYRTAMSHGDFALALRALQNLAPVPTDAAAMIDRDILHLVLGSSEKLECSAIGAENIGAEKPLCDLLVVATKNGSLTSKEKIRADIAPLIKNHDYRRRALEIIFMSK